MSYTVEDRLVSPNITLGVLFVVVGVFFLFIHVALAPDIQNWYFYIWIGLITLGVHLIIPK